MTSNQWMPRLVDLTIGDIPPFVEDVTFEFDSEVNLFIGPNATGKSTILRCLSPYFPAKGIPGYSPENFDLNVVDWPRTPSGQPDDDAVPQISLPAVREVPVPSPYDDSRVFYPQAPESWSQWDGLLDEFPYTSFQSQRVYLAVQKLFDEDRHSVPRKGRGLSVVRKALACVADIGRELVSSSPKDLQAVATLTADGEPFQITEVHYGVAVNTIESENEIYIGELSTGTQGLFWWIGFLALKLGHHYDYEEGWAEKPGILFIDEIENHLHPTWQRRVLPALRRHFPGVQIFATTHSPFVVAGLKRGQVHRLYREKGVVKTDKLTEEEKERKLVGWTVEEILREFMDVTDPTDEATAEAAATLRWLRERYPSDGEVTAVQWVQECIQQLQDNPERTRDEEYAWHWLKGKQSSIAADDATPGLEWRDATLDELRDMVSPDLEAGGPLAAQQELFIAQLRDLLADDETDSQGPDEEG